MISERTTRALQAAKARGKVLGNPNGARALQRAGKGNAAAVAEIRARADRHAQDVLPIVDVLEAYEAKRWPLGREPGGRG